MVTAPETLSISLTCSNARLPESLQIGDISQPLSPGSVLTAARNITTVRPGLPPPLGPGLLRQLTTHLYLNHLPLDNAQRLQALLELYLFPGQPSDSPDAANLKRILGIKELQVVPWEFLESGIVLKGREIILKVRQDHFAGAGDLYLFGCILHRFLGRYASLQCRTRLVIKETTRGTLWQWPAADRP